MFDMEMNEERSEPLFFFGTRYGDIIVEKISALTSGLDIDGKFDRQRAAAQVLVKMIFGLKTGVGHHRCGRPYLKNEVSGEIIDENISISHSGDLLCLALKKQNPSLHQIGVDIEFPSARLRKVGEKFLTPQEYAANIHGSEKLLAVIWSAKEAAFKLMSEEGLFLNNFVIRESSFNINMSGDETYRTVMEVNNEGTMIEAYSLVLRYVGSPVLTLAVFLHQ